MAKRKTNIGDDPKKALEIFLLDLYNNYYEWYDRSVTRHFWLWLPLQIIGVLCGFATSILAALATEDSFKSYTFIRLSLIILPALGSAVVVIGTHSKLIGRYDLRERGRLAVQALWNDGNVRFAAARTPEDYTAVHKDMIDKLENIESSQAVGFFSMSKL